MPTIIRGATLEPVPWRNGLGISRTIADGFGEGGELAWQIGIADLEGDAAFSHYPNCDRIFTPIAGAVPELSFDDGPFEPCPLLVPKPFAGDRRTLMRMAAPGRAFNLVVDRRRFEGAVVIHSLAAGETMAPLDATVVLIHCLAGDLVGFGRETLAAGDSLIGAGPAMAGKTRATLLAVAIRRR